MKETVRVVKVAPGEKPEVVEIENTLDAWQKAVSEGAPYQCPIEIVSNDVPGTIIVLNEEGKLVNLKPNRRYYDILVGTFYVCSVDKNYDFASLNDNQIKEVMKQFDKIEYFTGKEPELEFYAEFIPWDLI